MPEDSANLELLEVIHALQSVSKDALTALDLAIGRATRNQEMTVQISIVAATALSSLISLQQKLITGLTETNQQIADRAEDIARLLS